MEAAVLPAVIEEARRRQQRRRIAAGIAVLAVAAAILGPLQPWGSSTRPRLAGERTARASSTPPPPLTPGHGPHIYTYSQAVAAGIVKPFDPATADLPLCPKDPRAHTNGECMVDPRENDFGAGATQKFFPIHTTAVGRNAVRYVDRNGWSLVYPRRFHSRAFDVEWINSTSEGASFSNFGPAPSPGDVWDGEPPRVPRDGVLFELTAGFGGLGPILEPSEPAFPLELALLTPYTPSASGSVRHTEFSFQADGTHWSADAWVGTHAPTADRHALAAIVRSIRFPRLNTGERAGSYVVLDPPSAYPVGTARRFDRTTTPSFHSPFYLVHDASGFRTITWRAGDFPPKYKLPCDIQFDRARFQFFCPYIARWDSLGNVIVNPPGMSQPTRLDDEETSVSWDGHLLVPAR